MNVHSVGQEWGMPADDAMHKHSHHIKARNGKGCKRHYQYLRGENPLRG